MGERHLEQLAARVGRELLQRQRVMVTAESCTGGWVAQAVTAIAGSSAWFDCGFVTYSNAAKQRHGAVSEATVIEMAEGALRQSGADIAVSISGVAGPAGGSDEKPVGTVWFAWAVRGGTTVSCLSLFQGDREAVRRQAVEQALDGVIAYLV